MPPTDVLPSVATTTHESVLLSTRASTLKVSYHGQTVASIVSFLRAYDPSTNRDRYGVLLVGGRGTGKSFCLHSAAAEAGYTPFYVNPVAVDVTSHLAQALFQGSGVHGARTVVVVDGADEMEPSFVKRVVGAISRVAGRCLHPRNRRVVRLSLNPVVVTCCDKYNPVVYSLVRVLKTIDVYCNPPTPAQIQSLVRLSCASLPSLPTPKQVYTLASYGGDVAYILNRLQYEVSGVPGAKDRVRMDVFQCVGSLLDRPRPATRHFLEETDRLWEAGGEKVDAAVFNMYPSKVSHVQAGTDLAAHTLPLLLSGLEELSEIADALSWVDAQAGVYTEPCLSTFLRGTVATLCPSAARRRTKTRINLDTKVYRSTPIPTTGCLIDHRQRECLWFASAMHNIEVDRKLQTDRHTPLTETYELCNLIGWYTASRETAPVDSMLQPDEPAPVRKRKGGVDRYLTPRMRAIKAFSHTFPLK